MKKTIIGSIILLITATLFAQESGVQSFTQKEAVDYALKNNHDAKNAKLDMQKAKAFNWEIMTQGLPQVNGSFEYDYYFKTPQVPAVSGIFSASSPFGQSLSQLRQNSNDPALINTLNSIGSGFGNISFVLPNDISTGLTVTQLLFDARYMFGIQAR